ncbi:MAG: hypothetical protein ACE5IO_04410 [Thermoplasmata archaeon]
MTEPGKLYSCFGKCGKSMPYICCCTADRAFCAEGKNEDGRPCRHLTKCSKHDGGDLSAYRDNL